MDLFSVIKVRRALGVIIRNDQGALLASLSKKIDLPYEEVEARAAPRVKLHFWSYTLDSLGLCLKATVPTLFQLCREMFRVLHLHHMVILLKILGVLALALAWHSFKYIQRTGKSKGSLSTGTRWHVINGLTPPNPICFR